MSKILFKVGGISKILFTYWNRWLFLKKIGDHYILWACKSKVEVSKYVKTMVGLFISFVANVAQSCGNE